MKKNFLLVLAAVALIAACVLVPADYFAINAQPHDYAVLGMKPVDLPWLSGMIKENLAGRPGGAVSLAVGMAFVFSKIPAMDKLISYWYHFAIMFEAVFILTLIDAGTRAGRFLLQEMIGKVIDALRWIELMHMEGFVTDGMGDEVLQRVADENPISDGWKGVTLNLRGETLISPHPEIIYRGRAGTFPKPVIICLPQSHGSEKNG